MIKFLKKLFGRRPPLTPEQVDRRRPALHWIPNGGWSGRSFCGLDSPGLFTLDVSTLKAVENACSTCRDGGERATIVHRLTTR
jgi:hypothetical protein